MKSYILIEKKFSEKKNKAYLISYICFNDTKYLINLSNEVISVLLNCKVSDVLQLEVGYKSKELPIDLGY